MKKKVLLSILVIILVATSILFYLWKTYPFQETKISINSIILKIPVIEYRKEENKSTQVVITDYTNFTVEKGSEFVIDPETLGNDAGHNVGAVKLKLIEINNASIVVDILADKMWDKEFHPKKTIERVEIKNKSCISALPLVMDVSFEYCFNLENEDGELVLKYGINEESTMPGPW